MLKQIDCHGLSEMGKVRKVNDDQFLVAELNKSLRVHQTSLGFEEQTRLFGGSQGKLLLVADGVGSSVAGKRADSPATDRVVHYILNKMRWFFRVDEAAENDLLADLTCALKHCQAAVRSGAQADSSRREKEATITLAYMIWPWLYVVHAGDSRCYLFRNGKLTQITEDHPPAQPAAGGGEVAVQATPSRRTAMRSDLGDGRSAGRKPDGHKVELALGDTLLLCTDGLTRHVPDAQIARLLHREGSAREISHCLIDAAMDAGGEDNMTVVVARFQDATDEEIAAPSGFEATSR